ncbi:MAG: LPS export ABC transporter periplasmic protein LptC [Sphingomonadaceae bacterium]
MPHQARIETQGAKELRNARRHFAAPGGRHDHVVSLLSKLLPMSIGALVAVMVITPLSPRGEVSFLLDRNKVAVINERLRVDNALYRGADEKGQPFSITAGQAVQKSGREGIVRMTDLVARIMLPDGPARMTAEAAAYDIDQRIISVLGPVRVDAADGYSMVANGVSINMSNRTLSGSDGVDGVIPAGSFRADRMFANIPERTITLDGNARMTMVPGKLRLP